MGTRHITEVKNKEGKIVVSNYGQWDGYPLGQGLDIVTMINENSNLIDNLEKNLTNLKVLTNDKEIEDLILKKGIKLNSHGMMGIEEMKKLNNLLPQLSRDTGSKILELIANNPGIETIFSDSLEWIEYVNRIDFQKRVFEIYEVGQETPLFSSSLDYFISIEDFQKIFDNEDNED